MSFNYVCVGSCVCLVRSCATAATGTPAGMRGGRKRAREGMWVGTRSLLTLY